MQIYKYKKGTFPAVKTIIFLLVFLPAVLILVFLTFRKNVVSPIGAFYPTPSLIPKNNNKPDPDKLSKAIAMAFDDSLTEYSLIIDDFKSDFHFELGDQTTYVGASVLKIPILIHLYEEISLKKILPTYSVTIQESDIQDYGTGTLRYSRPKTPISIVDLASLMMRQSDNTAAYIIGRKILKFEDIQNSLNKWELTETNMEDNVTSNKDMNKLFRKLFYGQLLPAEETREAISLLTDSDYEERLPALLPKETKVYHKIGSTIAGIHDVGVVMGSKSLYYIGIFTRGVSDEERAIRAIARISKAVFEIMENN